MYLTGIIPFLLYLSTLFNVLLIWYTYQFVVEKDNIEKDIQLIFEDTEEFVEHIERIHELEMFYGDQNLQSLIDHSRELVNSYVDIQEKYYDVEVELESDEDDEEEKEE
jgi:hypothetical protein